MNEGEPGGRVSKELRALRAALYGVAAWAALGLAFVWSGVGPRSPGETAWRESAEYVADRGEPLTAVLERRDREWEARTERHYVGQTSAVCLTVALAGLAITSAKPR
jgi:hypothetical protein